MDAATHTCKEGKFIISLRNAHKFFGEGETEVRALNGINLDISQGEFVVILGASGCGKSTMLNIIGGLDTLTSGEFHFNGKNYSDATEEELTIYRRQSIGFIFQSYNLMPNLTAKENLDFIGELCDSPLDSAETLIRLGLENKINSYPGQMSGGQQQRVAIARALIKKPTVILADEPTAALDYNTSIEILTILNDIVKNGTTLLMVTHNTEIARMANRVLHMHDGMITDVIVNSHPSGATELQW